MFLPFFIARRIAFRREGGFSRVILRIATVAVALSIAVMVVASALIAGFKREISRKVFEFWGHIHITDSGYSQAFEPTPVDKNQDFYPDLDSVAYISYTEPEFVFGIETGRETAKRSRGGIQHIQVFANIPGIIRTRTAMEGVVLKGIADDFNWNNLAPYLQEGSPIAWNDSLPSNEVIVSRQTADRLRVGVGDKFIIHFVRNGEQLRRPFRIKGIYKTGLEEYDRKFALCDIRQVQALLGWQPDQVAGFEIWLDDIRDMDLYTNYLYQEVIEGSLYCISIKQRFPAIFEWLQLQDYNEIVLFSLMLAVAMVNMITALLVLVLERTNMIGILKALGERNRRIRWIFLFYAVWIMLNGIFWGDLTGLLLCWLQDKYHLITLNEADYYLAYAPVYVEWGRIAALNIGTLLVILLFLLIPSLLVSRISPLKSIRFR